MPLPRVLVFEVFIVGHHLYYTSPEICQIPRVGVPVESSFCVSRHVDVVGGVPCHSVPKFICRGSQLFRPVFFCFCN